MKIAWVPYDNICPNNFLSEAGVPYYKETIDCLIDYFNSPAEVICLDFTSTTPDYGSLNIIVGQALLHSANTKKPFFCTPLSALSGFFSFDSEIVCLGLSPVLVSRSGMVETPRL